MLLMEAVVSAEFRQALAARRGVVLLAATVWVVSIGAAVLQMLPPPDAGFTGSPTRSGGEVTRWDVANTSWRLLMGYVPLPRFSNPHFWDTHFYPYDGYKSTLVPLLLIVMGLFAASVLLFLRRPLVLFLYGIGTGGLLLFSYLFFAGHVRHHGHLYLVFVACLWLAALPASSWKWKPPSWLQRWAGPGTPWATAFLTGLLLVQVVAAVHAYAQDLRRPFSAAHQAADFLREHELDELPIAGHTNPETSTVAGLLDQPIYYLSTGTAGTFMRWGQPGANSRNTTRVAEQLRPFLDSAGPDAILLLTYSFQPGDTDLHVTELAHFPAGIERTERFRIYRVRRRDS